MSEAAIPGTPRAAWNDAVRAEMFLRIKALEMVWPRLAECADAIACLRELYDGSRAHPGTGAQPDGCVIDEEDER